MGRTNLYPSVPHNSSELSIKTCRQQGAQRKQWLAKNKGALEEYNRRIEARGTFSDGLRKF